MHAGHRYHGRLDFDYKNINCQCPRCNTFLHGNLGEYERKIVKVYGQEIADALCLLANEVHKYSIVELESIIAELKEKLEEV
jgi:hypothetical protein